MSFIKQLKQKIKKKNKEPIKIKLDNIEVEEIIINNKETIENKEKKPRQKWQS